MKPAPFAYRDPRTLDEIFDLLSEHGDEAALLAGGQSLVPLLNLRLARPTVVVDINRVPGLDGIDVREDGVELGALCRASSVEWHNEVRRILPVATTALRYVGHPQIRNRTTIGGSVSHADPASELPALLAMLDGDITLASKDGTRSMRWEEFFIGSYTTARRSGEVLTSVWLPISQGLRATFVEVARRHGDFAVVGACVGCERRDDVVAEARIALCGVANGPLRVRDAEQAITRRPFDQAAAVDLHTAVRGALDPPDDVHGSADYRRHVAATIVVRAMQQLWREHVNEG